jgi:dihydrodipicolinate synthase/N-acetylneuraminate lyase
MSEPLLQPIGFGREPYIIAALSVPVTAAGEIDFEVFARDVERTAGYGIEPAVLMDTYQINHCTRAQQTRGLEVTREVMAGRPFTAGVYIEDEIEGEGIDAIIRAYQAKIERFESHYGASPIIFQTERLKQADAATVIHVYRELSRASRGGLKAFELSPVFAPNGWMFPGDSLIEILADDRWAGAKHSSLNPSMEWVLLQKLHRIGKRLFTGNDYDFASMMFNGSDALLGIATFIPDKFRELADALRDGNRARYFDLAIRMEFLGRVAFQPPVPAYKHGAAMVKKMRGWYPTDHVLPNNPFTRDAAHREELRAALAYLGSVQIREA